MKYIFVPYLLAISLINSCIELEISAPGFPNIAQELKISDTMVGLTITYNLIGFCMASLFYGPLSEWYGRRYIMIFGNAILIIGAVGCIVSPTIEGLLVFRFIQGVGAATSAVIVSAIIADVYTPLEATKLYGIMNALFTSLMAFSPVLGGLVNSVVGWRGNYGVVAFISVLSWFLLFFYLPETIEIRQKLNVKNSLKAYKTVLSSRVFLSGAIIPSLLYGCYMSFVAIAPFLYMQTFKLEVLPYTLHQGIIVGGYAATSCFVGKLAACLGNEKALYIGLGASLLGTGFMMCAVDEYDLTISMSIFCIGSAILYPIIFSYSMEVFPAIKGSASSLIMTMRYLLCASLTGVANFFYVGTIRNLSSVFLLSMICITFLTSYFLRKIRCKV